MTSPTLIDIPIRDLVKHPKNPRRRAVADPELVDSIRTTGILQPPVVFQSPDGKYPILMGHRRVDGAKKAGLKTVTCLLRTDLVTEGQQVEAMLIENGRREDLTPIEEAEGFAQLQLFGYKQKDIAKATGRDPKTVSSRLKLLKLAKSTKDRVHKGQLTLDDALAITEFADDPDTTKKLEAAAKDGYNFKWAVQRARQVRKETADTAAEAADLRQRGVTELVVPAGKTWSDVAPSGTRHVHETGLRDAADHDGCLTFLITPASEYAGDRISYFCTNPKGHADRVSEEERRRVQEREEADRAREAERAAAAAAAKVRTATIMDTLGLAGSMSPPLRDLVRGLLPQLLPRMHGVATTVYLDVMHVHPDDRWEDNAYQGPQKRRRELLILQHVDDLTTAADNVLARALVAVLLATAEGNLQQQWDRINPLAVRYLDLLDALGHEPCDVDTELRTAIAGDMVEGRAS